MLYPLSYRRMSLPTGRTLLSVHPGDKSVPREDGHRAGVPAVGGDSGPVRAAVAAVLTFEPLGFYPTPVPPALPALNVQPSAPSTAERRMPRTTPITIQMREALAQFLLLAEWPLPKASISR